MKLLAVFFVASIILGWLWFERNGEKYARYYKTYRMLEGVVWPVERPGHRPSLGDFLVTDGSDGVEPGSGYMREDDIA